VTTWLVTRDGAFYKSRPTASAPTWRTDLEREVCPAVSATGVRNARWNRHWIEEDGLPDVAPAADKPPYRVPSMVEVNATPWNGYTVASTFAGCGGSSLGYRMAGFRVVWASEFVDAAREVYALNAREGTVVDGRDIREVRPEEILKATGLEAGQLDVLDGSPPCASFSTAGKRQAHWGQERKYSDKVQRTDDLFYEFARILEGLRPRAFVAENVSGLVKGVAKGYFLRILARLKACGYRVEVRVVDAQWVGVPQHRPRTIFVGVREDLAGVEPAHPAPLPYRYSVREAIPWIGRAVHDTKGQPQYSAGDVTDRPSATVLQTAGTLYAEGDAHMVADPHGNNTGFRRSVDDVAPTIRHANGGGAHGCLVEQHVEPESDIGRFAIGREADKLVAGAKSSRYLNLARAPTDGPSPAVTATGGMAISAASVIHPTERRKFSIAELRRICAFPDDFVLTGSYGQQWERLGRAVPPLMMRAIAEVVRDKILREADRVRDARDVRPRPRRRREARSHRP